MNTSFDIEIAHGGEKMSFSVQSLDENGNISYLIENSGVYYMTLECCNDETGDSLKLAQKDAERHIDPGIVTKVAELIESADR